MGNTKPHAILAAVSREFGIDLIKVYKNSVNISKFKTFLEELRSKYPFDSMLLVMDNLSVHKSNAVKERMHELGFAFAFTPAYSPAYNGIEEVWSIGKQMIKKKRLDLILKGQKEYLRNIIFESFERIDIMSISKCINRSIKLLNLNN